VHDFGPTQLSVISSYVNKDREVTKRIVQHAEKRGIKGLFITVDAPQLGRREKVRLLLPSWMKTMS
jgi:L-lactate dehydrogenase (cytochrome)